MNSSPREDRHPAAPKNSKPIEPATVPYTTRDDNGSDSTPPMISPARGPMDQATPDVPTGSTPLTRHDD